MFRHRFDCGWQRVSDTSATGLSDAANGGASLPPVATLRVSPGGAWRGAVPPLTPTTETARRERWSLGRVHAWTVPHADVERERTREVARIGSGLSVA